MKAYFLVTALLAVLSAAVAAILVAFLVAFLSAPAHAEAPKWVIVRSMCPETHLSGAGTPSTWAVMHTKCWWVSQTSGPMCALGLRGSFGSKAECAKGNGGVELQTSTAAGGMKDSLRCVPRSPTADVCGVSIGAAIYRDRDACVAANGGEVRRETPIPGGVERTRCEMSLD